MTALLAPADAAGVAAAVVQAAAAGEPLAVEGNGTKSGMLRPVQAARGLSTRNLSGITLYAPKELVISARAGTPLPEIEATVSAQGQHLIAEPPNLAGLLGSFGPQTLGGVVACNLSGPRRVAWGAMRDHVLGVRAVTGTGEIVHSGGRVLKNVTGLDLCKLLTGSHGTLAVLTEITMKVLPAPQRVGTVLVLGLDAAAAVAALSAGLGSPYGVSGAAWLPADLAVSLPELSGCGRSVALLRIEDFEPSVAYRTQRLRAELAGLGRVELLDDAASRSVWRAVRDADPLAVSSGEAVWRLSVRPSAGPAIVRAVADMVGGRCFLDWGGGLIWVAGPATGAAHAALTKACATVGGTWTVMRAPIPLRSSVAVIPAEPEALARITRRVKSAFDPHGILNPGRLAAGF